MKIKIWHVLPTVGVALIFGTIGAADMGAIGSTRIIAQMLLGIGMIVLSYRCFIAACNRAYKDRWSRYEKH